MARRLSRFLGLPGPLSARPLFAFPGASGSLSQNALPGGKWSALNQALARFNTHRFASERHFQALAPSLDQLRASLSGGQGLQNLLSPRFQGLALTAGRETLLREDACFRVSRTTWQSASEAGPPLDANRFRADLERFLAPHAPLALVDLQCTAIRAVNPTQAGSQGVFRNLTTRLRFELANTSRWEAIGEWEIDWVLADASGSKPSGSPPPPADWKIAGWRALEMTSVQASAAAFTDVTAEAFSKDPSYAIHLLRDTNYWRGVLDTASGIDIFGNCGVSVGDADGDGRDEIYLCQPQGLANRLYRQRSPGVFEDVAGVAGVDLLDATSMALFADVLNRGRQDLILITQSAPLLFLNDGHGKFTLAREAFPPSPQQASLTSAALGDYDRDGFLDLYVCSYGYFQGQEAMPVPLPYYDAQNGPPNHLYRNRGDGTFVDVTTASGLDHGNNRFSFACVWADIDDDGWLDLCVVNDFGRNNLYHNRRDGTFEEIEDGLPGYGSGMSAAFADLDGDGLGEVYAAGMWQPVGERVAADPEFQQRFADVGIEPVRDFAMGSNLYHATSAIAVPQSTSKGHEEALRPKASPKMARVPESGGARRAFWNWCADAFDLENDGWPDLYCLNGFFSSPTPELASVDAYLWEEVIALSPHTNTPSAGYRAAWGAIFELAHRGHPWDGGQRNVCFLNLGAGRFVEASAAVGLNFPEDSRSFAVFDYDGDGDADIVIHGRTGPQLRLLRNEIAHQNHSLAIRLTGTHSNRDAIGARVELARPGGRQVRFLSCGSGFVAQHSKEMVFGLGAHSEGTTIRVRWPRGALSEFHNLQAGYRYYLVEGESSPRREPLAGRDSGFGTQESAAPLQRAVGEGSALPREPGPPPVGHSSRWAMGRSYGPQGGGLPYQPEAIPTRFSSALIEPLPLPPLEALREIPARASAPNRSAGRYALLWLWNPAEQERTGLESFFETQGQISSRLVLWGDSELPAGLSGQLILPAWRADSRFREFCTIMLERIYDYRRGVFLPTGLLIDVGARHGMPVQNHGVPPPDASVPLLVKIYWGGADSEELLRDARAGVKTGAEALPFPGRAVLTSFRRDLAALGAALANAGLFSEAEIYLARAAEINPRDPDALFDLALVRREQGKPELAEAGIRAAIAVRPQFPEALNLLGVLLIQSGQAAKAQAEFEQAVRLAPDFVEAWNNLGYVLLLQNNLPAAETALERAATLAPDFPDTINNLGILRARRGDWAKAEELFRRTLALQPNNEQAANNLAVLYAKQGKTDEALATLRAVLARNPEAGSALLNLAKLDVSLGKTAEAREALNSWLARHPGDANALKLLERIK